MQFLVLTAKKPNCCSLPFPWIGMGLGAYVPSGLGEGRAAGLCVGGISPCRWVTKRESDIREIVTIGRIVRIGHFTTENGIERDFSEWIFYHSSWCRYLTKHFSCSIIETENVYFKGDMITKKQKVTIRDIVRATGYSTATVSRVLNRTNQFYSDETRAKIEQVAKELGYTPNMYAKVLKTNKTNNIAFLVPQMSDFYAKVFSGLQTTANRFGYSVSIYSSNNQVIQEELNVRNLCSLLCDGIVVASGFLNPDHLQILRATKLPMVSVEQILGEEDIPFIGIPDREAVSQAVGCLLDLGHRKIACFTAPLQYSVLMERYAGYLSAFTEHGFAADPTLVFSDPLFEQSGNIEQYRAIKEVLASHTFTAAMAFSDDTAGMILRAAHDLSIRVPEDLSVIGFDDSSMAAYFVPSLTTVRQDANALGCGAAEMILERIAKGHTDCRILAAELIRRESVAIPRNI